MHVEFMNALDAYAGMVLRMYPIALGETSKLHPEACLQWVDWLMTRYKGILHSNTRNGWLAYGVAMKGAAGGTALSDWWNAIPKSLKNQVLKEDDFGDAVFHSIRAIYGNDGNRQSIEVRLKMADGLLRAPVIRHLAGEEGIENLIIRQTGLLPLEQTAS